MLEVDHLNVYYEKLAALKDVSIALGEGEIVAIIGSNGAGKSTLLKTISGLVVPRSGRITLEGKRIDGLNADTVVELGVAHVPEGRRLFPFLSVQENLKVGSYPKRARAERTETMRSIIDFSPRFQRDNTNRQRPSVGENNKWSP